MMKQFFKHIFSKRPLCALCALLLLCVPLASCERTKHDPLTATAFLSLVADKNKQVTASTTLCAADTETHAEEKAYLFEVRHGESEQDALLREPVASATVSSEMKFSFSLFDGDRSRVYSSFLWTFEDKTPVVEYTKKISNPEILAPRTLPILWEESLKGLSISDASAAAALGTSHAMIPVSLRDLRTGNELSYFFDGEEFFASSEAISRLDAAVYASYASGMQVALRVSVDDGEALDLRTRASLLSLICSRYCDEQKGILSALYLDATSREIAESVELLTVGALALRSHTGRGDVYLFSPDSTGAGSIEFFTRVASILQKSNPMRFGAAISYTPLERAVWEKTDSPNITPQAYSDFHNALRKIPSGPVGIALCDVTLSSSDPDLAAASYAYLFSMAKKADFDRIFYATQSGDATGLFSAGGEARPISEIYACVDTGLTFDQLHMCEKVSPELKAPLEQLSATHKTLYGTASIGNGSGVDTYLFDFTDGSTHGFSVTGAPPYLEGSNPQSLLSGSYGKPALYAHLNADSQETGLQKVFSNGEAFASATSVSMHILPQCPKSAKDCTLTLRISGVDRNGSRLTYATEITISSGVWQTVTFHIASFTAAADLSEPVVISILSSTDAAEGERASFGFWIKSLKLWSPEKQHAAVWVMVAIPTGLAIGFVAIFLLYRRRQNRYTRGGM